MLASPAVAIFARSEPSEVYERHYRLCRRLYEQTKDIAAELSRYAP